MSHPRTHAKGFTLIEMSIVIVIIGLIMGAVTASRSYVRNAELNTVMNESKYYINQFNQFQTLYSSVPGDMVNATSFWSSVSNGDGNGLIHGHTATLNPNEVFYAFQHLAAASLISGSYSGATSGPGGSYDAKIGTNVPQGDVTGVTYVFEHPSGRTANTFLDGAVSADTFYQDGIYGHVLYVAAQPDSMTNIAGTNLPTTVFITPKEAYQMDGKFDDGIPTTGWMTVAKTLTSCFSGTAYDTGTANGGTKNCWFILNMR